MIALKFTILLSIIPLMAVCGIYVYRFLNSRLTSANSTLGLIFYACALFASLAAIYGGGLTVMALLYDYLTL